MKPHRYFLFKLPGQPGMYDFSEVRDMRLPSKTNVGVYQIKDSVTSTRLGKMKLSVALAKFR